MNPLEYFFQKVGFEAQKIKQFVYGQKYAVIELTDGYCGVCGHTSKLSDTSVPSSIDLENEMHRIVYVCYLNALFNREFDALEPSSFVEQIEKNAYKNIVMVGLFRPLLKRYEQRGIYPLVFDHSKSDPGLIPMHEQPEKLKNADLLILSATTLANNTFVGIMQAIGIHTKVAMTGPSSLLHPDFFKFIPNGIISGMVFKPNNPELIQCIKNGFGTQHFKIFGKKVDIYAPAD
jgi:uncharacterized protein (DUF4213/DUF364 family)